jgi:CMP-N,N'-diacetyllegionaminic acid synthase
MRVLGIITARGGSKGIPKKNLALLLGKPLLAYTVEAAQASKKLHRIILSSDDNDIITLGRRMGVEVPFVRPSNLSGDEAPSVDVVYHAVQLIECEEVRTYDAVVLLQPTAPLRTAEDIDAALELLENSGADSVISVAKLEEPHPVKLMTVKNGFLLPFLPDRWIETLRRQDLESVYYLNGAVYCVKRNVLFEKKSLWGKRSVAYIMPADRSVNIDDKRDLMLAELILKQREAE